MLSRSLLTLLIFACAQANAIRFRNAYVSFELPPNWNCKLEGSEWVCENQFSGKTKEAIIILTAKEVGPNDTLGAYMAHLQTPRVLQGKGGATTKSQVISVKQTKIGTQDWIDGLHLGSEVGPYFTRYLATIKDKIAILITFSAHKEHYTKYSGDFIKAVDSLRVVASKDTLAGRDSSASSNGPGIIGPPVNNIPSTYETEGLPGEGGDGAEGAAAKGKYFNYMIFAIVLLALGGFFYLRSSKPQPKKPKK
jgi:hypothetical protein